MAMLDPARMAAFPVLETSMSQLALWSRCDRRYMYRFVRGLNPIGASDALQWGSMFHLAQQEYYRGMRGGLTEASALTNAHWIVDKTKVIKNDNYGDTTVTLDAAALERMHDSIDYYYEQVSSKDDWDEIIKVEESIYLVIGYNGNPVLKIRSTLDLLARKDGKLVVVDHKTTGDVEQNVMFLGLDFQARQYPLAVKSYYDEEAILCYNMIDREVPPGFGRRSVLTETGRKRDAATLANMQRPERYLRREWLSYSEQQHNAFQMHLVQIALTLQFEGQSGIWPRREVKMGGMACDKCPYFEICKAELDGRVISDDSPVVTMAFTLDANVRNPKPQIIVPVRNPFA